MQPAKCSVPVCTRYCWSKILGSGLCSLASTTYFCTNPSLEGKNLLVAKYRACCWPYDQTTRRLNSSAGDLFGWLMHLVHRNYPGCWDCCCDYTVHRRLINGHLLRVDYKWNYGSGVGLENPDGNSGILTMTCSKQTEVPFLSVLSSRILKVAWSSTPCSEYRARSLLPCAFESWMIS